jgi:hypothetical protein
MKDGASFQTAKLYSIEVPYYSFGTCKIIDGAYFCGDHSCQSYKYIGQKHTKRTTQVTDRVVDTEWGNGDSPYKNAWEGDTRFTKMIGHETHSVAPRGSDQMAATYGHFDGKKINMAAANSMSVAASVRGPGLLSDLSVDSSAEAPAECLASCSADTTCIAYALKKAFPTAYASCLHYTRSSLPIVVGIDMTGVMDTDTAWETYVKITNEKTRSWMHLPTAPKGFLGDLARPTASGMGGPARRLEDLY